MSIHHQWVVHCDQSPLPNRCVRQIVVGIEDPAIAEQVVDNVAVMNDWAVKIIAGKKRHYCPYHRPVS